MIRSFAQFSGLLCAACLAFTAMPAAHAQEAAVAELTSAQAAVQRATDADADQYAPDLIQAARDKVSQAQSLAETRSGRKQAPLVALQALADADLARARSEQASAQARLSQEQSEIDRLQKALATPPPAPAPPVALPPQNTLPALPTTLPETTL
ncbi:protein of unknown function [Pseudoxanthomonas sp. GM95]|uniref:DUF4398 domain-containing protein n=1 Tax=Pseudoxanthomonas sp. GM95 TaxID=1881043 RepID=UPI0008D2911B|nr:DUF4398 domain-containing protein [Pseudoxanthomonas sp. GM95]SEK42429.1 protein of unknown function [Pseudoxanthomonas sp. GM95]